VGYVVQLLKTAVSNLEASEQVSSNLTRQAYTDSR